MTGEEMERAIEFLLQSQATLEEQSRKSGERIEQVNRDLSERIAETQRQVAQTQQQLAQTQQQLAQTNRSVQVHADTQTRFIEVVTKALDGLAERQSRTEETLKLFIETERRIDAALVESQKRTEAALAETERRFSDALVETERRLGEVIAESHEDQRRITEALAEGQRRTDDKVERLAETVERFIREGRNGKG